MHITGIKVQKISGAGRLKAYVALTFDDCFVVHNLKVIEGDAGLFVAMPNRQTRNGEYRDVAHPINSDFRAVMQEKVLSQYEKEDDCVPLDALEAR